MKQLVSKPANRSARRRALALLPLACLLVLGVVVRGAAAHDAAAQDEQGCYTIVAGRSATADGAVLVGHNEDNGFGDPVGMRRIARRLHEEGARYALPGGGEIAQPKVTFAYWWLAMEGLPHSDAVLNEKGVAVVSNNCPSREDRPDTTDGGIGGPTLRCLVAERARTAREGVELVGLLVETFGYTAPGRTMTIADGREAWLVCLVLGRHWVAARVPDDHVACVANTYTIGEVDLGARDRFLACDDLVEYAVERGWYDPGEGPFSFEKAYADRHARERRANTHRQWSGLLALAAGKVPSPEAERLPFSVTPKVPLDPRRIATVLRDHYENAPIRRGKRGKGPKTAHRAHTATICSPATNSSSILQLRTEMPVAIGALWWCAMRWPCASVYVPLYSGMDGVPGPLAYGGTHGDRSEARAYTAFGSLARWIEEDYPARIGPVRTRFDGMERAAFTYQKDLERYLLDCWREDRAQAREVMSNICSGMLHRAMETAQAMRSSP